MWLTLIAICCLLYTFGSTTADYAKGDRSTGNYVLMVITAILLIAVPTVTEWKLEKAANVMYDSNVTWDDEWYRNKVKDIKVERYELSLGE